MSIASSPASACALPLAAHFSLLQDPRVDRTKQHLLLDIVVIAFCAVLCGAEGWEDMEEFGRAKHAWLKERLELPLPNGIPTDDTFRRLFARLDPEQFGRCFLNFAHSLHTYTICTPIPKAKSSPSTASPCDTASTLRPGKRLCIW